MLKLTLQYFSHLLWRGNSLEKTLMLGNIEGRRRREQHRMRWLDDITNSMDMFSSVHFSCSVMSDFLQPHGLQQARLPCPSPSPGVCSNSCALSRMMPSNHLILCYPLLLPPSTFPSIRVFSSELALHIRWPKYWHFSFSISPSNEYSGLISLRINWFDLLAVQGTLKSLLQHHSSGASVLWLLAFIGWVIL